jgi:hypothetical protein
MVLNVKTNTTLTMEDTVLTQARQAAAAEGLTRDKPSALGADRVLVLSTSTANAVLPTVFAVPVVANAPRMPALTVVLSADDPLPGCSATSIAETGPVAECVLVRSDRR